MQETQNIVSLDDLTANLLTALAELWGTSRGEVVRLALEETSTNAIELDSPAEGSEAPIIRAALESILRYPDVDESMQLTKREKLILDYFVHGVSNAEIASALNVSEQLIRVDFLRLKAKLRNRLHKQRRRQERGLRTRVKRLRALADLHHRLSLTPMAAAAWQESVREARR